ncbi:hypothetical protein MAUB1S_05157 [Mycolicibacterium aubagnense]
MGNNAAVTAELTNHVDVKRRGRQHLHGTGQHDARIVHHGIQPVRQSRGQCIDIVVRGDIEHDQPGWGQRYDRCGVGLGRTPAMTPPGRGEVLGDGQPDAAPGTGDEN